MEVRFRFADGGTLLHHYVKEEGKHSDNDNYLRFLLEKRIEVNAVDKDGNSALFYALQNG